MKRILGNNGDVVSTFDYDSLTDTTIIQTVQDCEPILNENRRLREMNDGYSPSRELKRIASIPMELARKWIHEAGLNEADFWQWPARAQNEFFRRKYRSNEYQDLRTS